MDITRRIGESCAGTLLAIGILFLFGFIGDWMTTRRNEKRRRDAMLIADHVVDQQRKRR